MNMMQILEHLIASISSPDGLGASDTRGRWKHKENINNIHFFYTNH